MIHNCERCGDPTRQSIDEQAFCSWTCVQGPPPEPYRVSAESESVSFSMTVETHDQQWVAHELLRRAAGEGAYA